MGKRSVGIVSGFLGVIFAFCFLFALLITSIEIVCYHIPGYFEREYEKYDVLSSLPAMSMDGDDSLMAVTEHMMRYLRGDEGYDELQIEVTMGGERRGFFSEREILHMEDVRELFIGAMRLRTVLLAVCMIGLILMAFLEKGLRSFIYRLARSILIGTGILFLGLAVLLIAISRDFTAAFTTFHHIFFDNDLWILDGNVDMLINIVPEGFFCDTAIYIAAIFGACLVILILLCALGIVKTKRKKTIP